MIETTEDYEEALGLEKPDYELRARVAKCFGSRPEMSFPSTHQQKFSARDREVKKRLDSIKKAARRLDEALLNLNHAGTVGSAGAAAAMEALLDRWDEALQDEDLHPLDPITAVSVLAEETDALLESLPPDKGGPTSKFYPLVIDLANVYEDTTGKQAGVSYNAANLKYKYGGPFFRFVSACLGALAPDLLKENVALGRAIHRALVRRRQTSPQ